jgi:hypothetical protein
VNQFLLALVACVSTSLFFKKYLVEQLLLSLKKNKMSIILFLFSFFFLFFSSAFSLSTFYFFPSSTPSVSLPAQDARAPVGGSSHAPARPGRAPMAAERRLHATTRSNFLQFSFF